MTIDQLRNIYDAQPFRPFVIHLADGRQVPVASREVIMVVPSGQTFAVGEVDVFHIIDVVQVTKLELRPATNGSRKRRRK